MVWTRRVVGRVGEPGGGLQEHPRSTNVAPVLSKGDQNHHSDVQTFSLPVLYS